VKEVIDLFEKISGTKLKYSVTDRRTGDIAEIYAKTDLANEKLNWKAEKNIKDMLRSAWEWEKALRAGEK
jgi:UDP-glucose 4-epimerase